MDAQAQRKPAPPPIHADWAVFLDVDGTLLEIADRPEAVAVDAGLIEPLKRSAFRRRFVAKGRYQDYLDAIPTFVITAEHPAFRGLIARLDG